MKLPFETEGVDQIGRARFAIILVRPENHENIGLVARAMKNTGFADLRLVGLDGIETEAYKTAVHADDILDGARFYPDLAAAAESLHLVFASTARIRKKFAILTFPDAMETILRFPPETRIGLLFGNERTGLTGEELGSANFIFSIPQAVRQPSYNLASAVLLTLFAIFARSTEGIIPKEALPLRRKDQDDCIRVILMKLEQAGFIHATNRTHITRKVQDIFGRIALTDKDRKLLMAIFNKGVE
jgi:tRNA/rRNA methyltransferase